MALVHQRDRRHDLAGCAISTLQAIVMQEGRLHRMQFAVLGQALDGRDHTILATNGERQAGDDATAVDMNRARTTGTAVAAFLGSGQASLFAQYVKKGSTRFDGQFQRLAVDLQCNLDCISDNSRPAAAPAWPPAVLSA